MSDIGLDFPWWAILLVFVAVAFLPLTVAAAGCAYWVARRRASRVARTCAYIVGALWLISAGLNVFALIVRSR